jgi:iron complex outermembrane receptor protein
MLKKQLVVGASASALVVLGMLATPAFAEQGDVVVTGSAIRGTPENAALPVEAINLDKLERQGMPTNMDLIKRLTEIGSVQGETNRDNALPVGAGSVNLRSLGSNRTVVLFNGRRWGDQYSVTIGRFNNTNQIPNAVIGRVEVLKDGGNAIYGADAVGGVVNYFSRKNFKGLELNASGRYIDGEAGDYTASALWGQTFDRGNVMIAVDYQHRSELPAAERDWTQLSYFDAAQGLAWSTANNPGSYIVQTKNAVGSAFTSITLGGTGINKYTGDRTVSSGGVVRDKACADLGGFLGFNTTPSPVCYFHRNQFNNLVERSNQYSIYAEANYQVASNMKWHVEGYYYRDVLPKISLDPSDQPPGLGVPIGQQGCGAALSPLAPGAPANSVTCSSALSVGYSVPGNNPAVLDFLSGYNNIALGGTVYTPAQIAAITQGGGRIFLNTGLWRPFGSGGNPTTDGPDYQQNSWDVYRVVSEVSGDFGHALGFDLNYTADALYQRTVYKIETRDMLIDRLQASLNGLGGPNCSGTTPGANGCQWFNPFSSGVQMNPVTGQVNKSTYKASLTNDPALVNWLYAEKWLHRPSTLFVADYQLTGSGGPKLWGGPIAFALGGQYRWQREVEQTNDLNNRGKLDFFGNLIDAQNPCPTIGMTDCLTRTNTTNRTGPYVFARSVGGVSRNSTRTYPSWAVFGEVNAPVLPNLTLDGAIRFEQYYHDLTGSSDNNIVWAGSMKWQALDWLALRATAGNTFYNFGGGEISVTRTPATTAATLPDFGGVTGMVTYSSPTPALESEHGLNFNVGTILQKGNFRATFDYFRIKINDQLPAGTLIGNITANVVVAGVVANGERGAGAHINCDSTLLDADPLFDNQPGVKLAGYSSGDQHAYCKAIAGGATVSNSLGAGSELRYFSLVNGADVMTDGIDVNTSYRFDDIAGGALQLSGDVTWTKDYDVGDFFFNGIKIRDGYSALGSLNEQAGQNGQHISEWRFNISLNYSKGPHNFFWSTRGLSSLVDNSTTRFSSTGVTPTWNANIGDANGAVNAALCAQAPNTFLTFPPVAANVGTGVTGAVQGTGAAAQIGYIAACNVLNTQGQTLPWTFISDFTYRLRLPKQLNLSFTVYNVFDQRPQYSRCAACTLGYDAYTGDPLGRNFKFSVSKRF